MDNNLARDLDYFDYALEQASVAYSKTDGLVELIKTAPERELNNTAMQVLNHAIESLQERSGVFYNTLALESVQSTEELRSVTLEGFKEFVSKIWEAIKKAIIALYNKIKEYFTSGEREVKNMKDDLDKAKSEFKDVEKSILKADKEATSVVMELVGPSPYLIHNSLYKSSNPVKKIELHDIVTNLKNYAMTSEEHHLLEGIEDYREDIAKLIAALDGSTFDTTILDKVYAIMNNYASEKKLEYSAVVGMRQHKDVSTTKAFDSTYGSKRFEISFSVSKKKEGEDTSALVTDQIVSKVHSSRDAEKLLIDGVESRDAYHLVTAVEENLDYLTKQVEVSKDLLNTVSNLQTLMQSIDSGKLGTIHSGHVLTLSVISKSINSILKLFNSMRGDYSKVVGEHLNLYVKMVEELKTKVAPV